MFKYVDWFLLIVIFTIVGYSLLSITNATAKPIYRIAKLHLSDILANLNLGDTFWQFMFFLVGLGLIVVITLMDYNNLRHYTEYIYWVCIAFLVVLLIPGIGSTQNGTTGWFMIGATVCSPANLQK